MVNISLNFSHPPPSSFFFLLSSSFCPPSPVFPLPPFHLSFLSMGDLSSMTIWRQWHLWVQLKSAPPMKTQHLLSYSLPPFTSLFFLPSFHLSAPHSISASTVCSVSPPWQPLPGILLPLHFPTTAPQWRNCTNEHSMQGFICHTGMGMVFLEHFASFFLRLLHFSFSSWTSIFFSPSLSSALLPGGIPDCFVLPVVLLRGEISPSGDCDETPTQSDTGRQWRTRTLHQLLLQGYQVTVML